MNDAIKDGGGAFPFCAEYDQTASHGGMSLRDWFAGQALTGLLAQTNKADRAAEFARQAYLCADAMLKAREAKS